MRHFGCENANDIARQTINSHALIGWFHKIILNTLRSQFHALVALLLYIIISKQAPIQSSYIFFSFTQKNQENGIKRNDQVVPILVAIIIWTRPNNFIWTTYIFFILWIHTTIPFSLQILLDLTFP